MWKSLPDWALVLVAACAWVAGALLQRIGASNILQYIAFAAFFGAIFFMILVRRARAREVPPAPVSALPLKKSVLNFFIWLILIFIGALAYGNGYSNWAIAGLVVWAIIGVIINLVRKRQS